MNKLYKVFIFLSLVFVFGGTFAVAQTQMPQGKWKLVSYNFTDKVAYPIDELKVVANTDVSGRIGGNAGCNGFGGEYKITGDHFEIGRIITTMMACEEPRMSFERNFLKVLEGASRFTYRRGKLTIYDDATKSFVRFRRVSRTPEK